MTRSRKLISFDWAIKRILRNKANFAILEGFMSELLKDDITIKSILESESNLIEKRDKTNRVDLLVENARGQLIIIEIQHDREYDYLQRILYGTSKLLVEHMESADPYSKVRKVISISIVYFDLGQGDDYIYRGITEFKGLNKNDVLELNGRQQELYNTESISGIYPEYYIIKVNRFDDIARNSIDEWIYFLKHEEIKDEFKAKGLLEAKDQLDIMKLSDEERREYEAFQGHLHYEASMLESHYGVGIRDGFKKGKKEGIIEMAQKLKAKGMDPAAIAEISGLSLEEVENL